MPRPRLGCAPARRWPTRLGIAQVWVDHTGHDTSKIYGTKTKEWQFDAVFLLSKAERPDLEIAFTMTATKARRRKPSNRTHFATVTLTMEDDNWRSNTAPAGTMSKPLKDKERELLRILHEVFADPTNGAKRRPIPPELRGGDVRASDRPVTILPRERVREAVRKRGWFGDATDVKALSSTLRERF